MAKKNQNNDKGATKKEKKDSKKAPTVQTKEETPSTENKEAATETAPIQEKVEVKAEDVMTPQTQEEPKKETAPKKPPKEFVLKAELETALIDGKSIQNILDEMTPKLAKSCGKDNKWAHARIRQELGFFHNYSGHVTYKLDIANALASELSDLLKDSEGRVAEILKELLETTKFVEIKQSKAGEPAAPAE